MRSLALACALALASCVSTEASSEDPFPAQADQLLEAYHAAGQFSGAVLVAEGDTVIYQRGIGLADRSWDIANSPDTHFRIASATKQFTAALVLRLYEEGKIDLDEPIITYLPDYPRPQGEIVTVRHLLLQTSGIPNYTSLPDWRDRMRDPHDPDDFLNVFAGLDLAFPPGAQFQYSNSNYFVLGVIIEKVTGLTYAEAMRTLLLEPLGLTSTGYHHRNLIVPNMAQGYEPADGVYQPEDYTDPTLPYAAGMLYSTVGDLLRWKRALHGGRVFARQETLTLMLTPSGGGEFGYAMGIARNQQQLGDASLVVVGHGGRIEGFRSDDKYFPEREWTVIVLSNHRDDVAKVADDLTRLRLGQSVELP